MAALCGRRGQKDGFVRGSYRVNRWTSQELWKIALDTQIWAGPIKSQVRVVHLKWSTYHAVSGQGDEATRIPPAVLLHGDYPIQSLQVMSLSVRITPA